MLSNSDNNLITLKVFGIFIYLFFMISWYISFTMSVQILQNLSESINYLRDTMGILRTIRLPKQQSGKIKLKQK